MAEFEVKGSSIRSKFDFVRERFGPKAEKELRAEVPQLATVLDSVWYPFADYDELLVTMTRRFFRGRIDQLSVVGEYSAQKSLSTVYSAYGQQRSFDQLLEKIATLHRRFYNLGAMYVTMGADEKSCQITLGGAPSYSNHDLEVARGFYMGSARYFGHENVTCQMKANPSGATFSLTWK